MALHTHTLDAYSQTVERVVPDPPASKKSQITVLFLHDPSTFIVSLVTIKIWLKTEPGAMKLLN